MADLPRATQPGELVYRPISGLALAGFVLSALFAAMVLLSTLVGLVQGLPVFLPDPARWLAVAAAVLCFLAQRRIRNAEGTLAGLALARWGLGLSVLLGATYFVYTWVTGLALAKQANDFLMDKTDEDSGFFPRLKNAKKDRTDLYQAFLLSLPTTSRGGSKAANEQKMLDRYDQPGKDGEGGNITNFSKHPLVLALSKNPDTQIEPLSVSYWDYDKNAYHVVRNYRFTTPEMVIETAVVVHSTEGAREGEQRKWFIDMRQTPPRFSSKKLTPYGEKLAALRRDSKGFLEKRRTQLLEGTPLPQYKETDTNWTKVLPKKDQREHVQKMLGEIFRCERKSRYQIMLNTDDDFADVERALDGRMQVHHLMKMILSASADLPAFNLELEFTAATTDPVDLAAPPEPPVRWEIRKIRVKRAAVAPKITGSG